MRVKSLRAKDCTKGPGIGEYRSSKDGSIRWAIDKRAEVEGGGSVNDETPYFISSSTSSRGRTPRRYDCRTHVALRW